MACWMKMMKMKKLLFVPVAVLIVLALAATKSGPKITRRSTIIRNSTSTSPNVNSTTSFSPTMWTTGHPGQNLNGKMFTMSANRGGVSFYPPSFRYTTTTTTTNPLWTTASPTRGVSVCLRYITDSLYTRTLSIFTLSPSRNLLGLGVRDNTVYWLHHSSFSYDYVYLTPSIRLWPNLRSDIWTSVCITVDSGKNVVQMFSGSNMSIRKLLPFQYVWSGEPMIDFSGFDGQLTDVQVWDYPLSYGEVYNYMTHGVDGAYRGSVLSWSYISYSVRGNMLLEDSYEAKQSVRTKGRGPEVNGKPESFFKVKESEEQRL